MFSKIEDGSVTLLITDHRITADLKAEVLRVLKPNGAIVTYGTEQQHDFHRAMFEEIYRYRIIASITKYLSRGKYHLCAVCRVSSEGNTYNPQVICWNAETPPQTLEEHIILTYSNPGDIVLNLYATGDALAMTWILKRKAIALPDEYDLI